MGRRESRTQVFDGVTIFAGCDRRILAEMAPHADRVRVRAGRVLAIAGRHAWQLVVLTEGTARSVGADGVHTLVAGQAIAPAAVAERAPLPATVTALTDAEVVVVNGPAFTWAVGQHPALARPLGGATTTTRSADPSVASRRRRVWRAPRRSSSPARGTVDGLVAALRLTADRSRPGGLAAASASPAGRSYGLHGRNSNLVTGIGR